MAEGCPMTEAGPACRRRPAAAVNGPAVWIFSGAVFRGVVFAGAVFRGADLSRAALTGAVSGSAVFSSGVFACANDGRPGELSSGARRGEKPAHTAGH